MTEVNVQSLAEKVAADEDVTDPAKLDPRAWLQAGGQIVPTDEVNLYVDQAANHAYNKASDRIASIDSEITMLENKDEQTFLQVRSMTDVPPSAQKIAELRAEQAKLEQVQADAVARMRENRMVVCLKGIGAKWTNLLDEQIDKDTADKVKSARQHLASDIAKLSGADKRPEIEALREEHKAKVDAIQRDGNKLRYATMLSKTITEIRVPTQGSILSPVNWTPQEVQEFLDDLPVSEATKLITRVVDLLHTSQMVDPLVDAGFPG